jgi:hypothetical protein
MIDKCILALNINPYIGIITTYALGSLMLTHPFIPFRGAPPTYVATAAGVVVTAGLAA